MTDVLFKVRDSVLASEAANPLDGIHAPDGYYVATIHRAENTNDPARLQEIVQSLSQASKPVVLLAHPRVRAKAEEHGIELTTGSLITRDPLSYPELISAVLSSAGVVTDSGGLQRKHSCYVFRVPLCVRRRNGWKLLISAGTYWQIRRKKSKQL